MIDVVHMETGSPLVLNPQRNSLGSRIFAVLPETFKQIYRRKGWLTHGLTLRKVWNVSLAFVAYLVKANRVAGAPFLLKIDISPVCSLRCPTCLHADPKGRNLPLLEQQVFGKHDRMTVDDFRKLIDQVRGRSHAVSLFYYGDPFAHPQIDQLCSIARGANLMVHATSHFSYGFSDTRIASIARSGLTHLTVAIDGSRQDVYGSTRVGGRLDLVLSNLRRLAAYRRDNGLLWPHIEVQHLVHKHHPPNEMNRVREMVAGMGIDQFTVRPGSHFTPNGELENTVRCDTEASSIGTLQPQGIVPRCVLPYFSTLIRFNGDVIPCCFHRTARQHTRSESGRATIGNAFENPLSAIWNSLAYRQNRRLVSNPQEANRDFLLKSSFCYGCSKVSRASKERPGTSQCEDPLTPKD